MLWLLAACTPPTEAPVDADGDGFASDVDCDDGDAAVYPGANEFCDGIDNDCDGAIDDDPWGERTYFRDDDGDGFGTTERVACERPEGYAFEGGDCDDVDPTIHPDAIELCDQRDRDCNGTIDDAIVWPDADGDGFADEGGLTERGCALEGYARTVGDCDDNDPHAYPGAPERCSGTDDDCDGLVDDADTVADPPTWYPDADGDGFGTDAFSVAACDPGPDWSLDPSDCDDFDPDAFPGAPERCDAIDQDCDGELEPDAAYALGPQVPIALTAHEVDPIFIVPGALPAGISHGDRAVVVFGDCDGGFQTAPARFLDDGTVLGVPGSALVVSASGPFEGTREGVLYLDADPLGAQHVELVFSDGAVTDASVGGVPRFDQVLARPGVHTPSGLLALVGSEPLELDAHPTVTRWVHHGTTTNPSGTLTWRTEWAAVTGSDALWSHTRITAVGDVVPAPMAGAIQWFAIDPVAPVDPVADPPAFDGVTVEILDGPASTALYGAPDLLRLASDAPLTLSDQTTIEGTVVIGRDRPDAPRSLVLDP